MPNRTINKGYTRGEEEINTNAHKLEANTFPLSLLILNFLLFLYTCTHRYLDIGGPLLVMIKVGNPWGGVGNEGYTSGTGGREHTDQEWNLGLH